MPDTRILYISLGCDKNLVDSEQMIALLKKNGYSFTDDEAEADVVIINSCCFIGDAKEESIEAVLQAGELKKSGQVKCIILTGCLAERYADEIRKELPEVDAIVGTTAFDRIADVMDSVLKGERPTVREDINRPLYMEGAPELTAGGHYAYLKIAEGCDKRCTYCIIPSVRGQYRSVPMEKLLSDARLLAKRGVKELILVAQETTVYGMDLYGRKALPELLKALCQIEGFRWIRLLYCYPEEIDENLIQVIREEEKVCKYLDLPIQHISDRILKRMGRRTSGADIKALIHRLREEIPGIALRTTLISGFPGENQKDHEELLEFIKEARFDFLGCFAYSREEDTPAADYPDQVPEEIKEKRRGEIMETQQELAFERVRSQTGQRFEVMIEGRIPEDHVYVGRTERDAPDVDGYVFISDPENGPTPEWMTGDFVTAEIIGANGYDLIGEVLE
ncbi:MAG: 30S ribosomal protein S12 methylthiotransferase RimO [Lachnospiraceae bacterium]|nr:30S ribosomal protein S12 methylthiotransferase RimO [Lachnospiraceae bacterium]